MGQRLDSSPPSHFLRSGSGGTLGFNQARLREPRRRCRATTVMDGLEEYLRRSPLLMHSLPANYGSHPPHPNPACLITVSG